MRNHSQGFVLTTTTTTMDEILMVDILSRLPAKSLMRFKCVSKIWLSLIQKDKHFFSLHSSCRSKLNTKIQTLDLFKRRIEDVTKIPRTWEGKLILGPVNGMLCFVNKSESSEASFLIYNLCTKEESPLITSNLWENNSPLINHVSPLSGFGFDHVTQEHKVLFVWPKKTGGKEVICEVLTVGENTWRTTHQVLPVKDFAYRDPVYLNGFIYWFISNFPPEERMDNILAFDVGKEKFRLIKPPPNGIRYIPNYQFILEVDGQLAIMERMVYVDRKKVTKRRVWTYIDQEEGENNYRWRIWEMIELPCRMENDEIRIIKSIPGTDLFIIKGLTNLKESPFVYIYDMKKKKFSENGSMPRPENKFRNYVILSILEESIYPVGTQLAVRDHHDQMIPTRSPPRVDTEECSNVGLIVNLCFLCLFSALYVFRK